MLSDEVLNELHGLVLAEEGAGRRLAARQEAGIWDAPHVTPEAGRTDAALRRYGRLLVREVIRLRALLAQYEAGDTPGGDQIRGGAG